MCSTISLLLFLNFFFILEVSKTQEVHQCVCYLEVNEEANSLDFSCHNPFCKFEGYTSFTPWQLCMM